jgi:hypothetical protein
MKRTRMEKKKRYWLKGLFSLMIDRGMGWTIRRGIQVNDSRGGTVIWTKETGFGTTKSCKRSALPRGLWWVM